MSQMVLIAYSGGIQTQYLIDTLAAYAALRGEKFAYYRPTRASKEACSEYIAVWLGESPLCKEPTEESADVLVSLEELEGRRNVRYVKQDGVCVMCSAHRLPMAVAVGTVGYPNDILYRFVREQRKVYQIRRVEINPCAVSCVTLRALGCDQATCETLLAQYPDRQAGIDYAFGLSFAK